jgi:hypothetical protein
MSATPQAKTLVLTTSQIVAAKPQMAYGLISDLAAYASWAPFLTIAPAAKAAEPGQLDFRIRVGKIPAPFVLVGEVVAREPGRRIVWRMGGFGIRLLETFEIAQARGGTQIIHTVQCDGWLKGLIGNGLLRTYGGVMRALDAAIARRLAMPKIRR